MTNNINSKVDSIETVNVLNGVRIFFFMLAAAALLLNLAAIVLSAAGRVESKRYRCSVCPDSCRKQLPACPEELVPEVPENAQPVASEESVEQVPAEAAPAQEPEVVSVSLELVEDAKEALAGAEQEYLEVEQPEASVAMPEEKPEKERKVSACLVSVVVRVANVAALFGFLMFSLTSSFTACVSLCANLGGLSCITRAAVKSFAALVIFMPWQLVFSQHIVTGAMFTPQDLLVLQNLRGMSVWHIVFVLARFIVPWLIVALLISSAMADSIGWKRRVTKRIGLVSE